MEHFIDDLILKINAEGRRKRPFLRREMCVKPKFWPLVRILVISLFRGRDEENFSKKN